MKVVERELNTGQRKKQEIGTLEKREVLSVRSWIYEN